MGLEYDSSTGEPFLRLPPPWSTIIITPPQTSDAASSVDIMNHPAVYRNMGRTSAYNVSMAEKWIAKVKAQCDLALQDIQSDKALVVACPVRHIREVREDGMAVFIGDAGLVRSPFTEIKNVEERARRVAENEARVAGDPEIVWHVGYYLAPSHHARGIMSTAVNVLIHDWGIPHMGLTRLTSSAFEGNIGSLKVLKNNGFVEKELLVDHVAVGDEKRSLHFLEWQPQ
ncbi:acyl-CoA N-acyltransferase [Mycena amicta]|nr:acyl-CoA N-acyltransferase [Mycena amicta]